MRRPLAYMKERWLCFWHWLGHNDSRVLAIIAIASSLGSVYTAIDSQQQAKSAEKMAKENLDEVKKQVEIVKQQAEREQRPWVGVDRLQLNIFEGGKPVRANALIRNAGKAIALDVSAGNYLVASLDKIDIARHIQIYNMDRPRSSHGVLLPGATKNAQSISNVITQKQIDYLRSGKGSMYFYGRIDYQDTFAKRYFTEFCGVYEPKLETFIDCGVHNSAN